MAKSGCVSKKLHNLDDRINKCIQDISDLFGGIENLDRDYIALNTDEISKEFQDMLEKLESLLSDCYEISEYLLPHLDEMRKQNNMKYCKIDLQLSKVKSDEILKDQLLWDNVCFYIEKYSFSTVFKNYIPLSHLHNHFNICRVRNYCICLLNMFAPKDIWEKYKNFRLKYLEIFICSCESDGSCFSCYLKLTIQCVYEDHLLCYIGCFHPHIVTQTNILDIYSKIIHNEFLKLLRLVSSSLKCAKNLPQEIINMLLNSKSTSQENFKTCFTCFVQSNLSSEIEAIIHCIQNNMDTDSLWKKLFIFSILKIIEMTSLFEDQISILFNLSKDINFHSHSDDLSSLYEASKLILATDSPEESPFHNSQEHVEKSHSANKTLFSWNWRLILVENGFITEIQRSLQAEVENMINTTTQKEKLLLRTDDWKNLLNYEKIINFSSLTVQTSTLLDSVLYTVLVLEKYVPILTCAIGVFQPFKYSFCHTLDTYVVDLLKHLEYLHENGNNIYFTYIVVNNSFFLKNQLKYYCDIMDRPEVPVSESCLNNVCHSVNKFADKVLEDLLHQHYKYVSCGILFDAESYNFEDTKPFFEGERISFSIQMWKMYMEGIYHDANYFLPQSFAQELYGKVLSFSLDRFLIRYSKSSVSEARYPQLLQDIYVILLCTSELIYPACSYVSDVTGKKEEFNDAKIASIISKIHSNCCCLLSVLIVLTSPMSELYKIFKDGFPQPRLSIRSKYECISPWLPWIRRELFSNFGQSKLMSNVSVWLAVKVCTTYKVPLPNAIIQAFTEHQCTLSILLMMQATTLYEEEASLSDVLEENKINLAYSLSVLMLCNDNYSYILDIFLPVIEKTNGWDEFDVSSSNKDLSERSWWYRGLYKALKPFLKSAFEEMTSYWFEIKRKNMNPDALKCWMNFRDELKKHIVCVCHNNSLNSFNEYFAFSTDIVSFLCVEKILEKLYDHLMFMPQPFKYALTCLDAHIVNYMPEIQPTESSLCIQFLLSSAITYLNEQEFVNNLPDIVKDMAVTTSNALYSLCKREDIFFKSVHYKKRLSKLLSGIREEFDAIKNNFDTKSKPGNFDEIQDDIMNLTARKLIEQPKGINIILYLHQILCANESWIQSNLGIPDMLSSDIVVSPISPSPLLRSSFSSPRESIDKKEGIGLQTSKLPNQKYSSSSAADRGESFDSEGSLEHTFIISREMLQLDGESETDNRSKLNLLVTENVSIPVFDFNPLKKFSILGASTFSKIVQEMPSLPWEALISHLPILGITEINFQVLFSQRWDIKNEVTLSSEEMSHIEELKALYKHEG